MAESHSPEKVLDFWPYDGPAQAALARNVLVQDQSEAGRRRAAALSVTALQASPLEITAVTNLGLLAALENKKTRATRLFHYAEQLSRRDLPTQVWLIDQAVRQNDIRKALKHYDIALLTSTRAGPLLVPVLARASSNPEIAEPLAEMLKRRPLWWPQFTTRLIQDGESSSEAIHRLVSALRLQPQVPGERQFLVNAIRRLIDAGQFAEARSLYEQARGGVKSDAQIQDASFEGQSLAPPFDWEFVDEPNLAALVQRSPVSTGRALFIVARNGRGGVVARQLLALEPGRYTLGFFAGSVQGNELDRPQVRLACHRQETPILNLALPVAPASGRRITREFNIPAGCPAQWITITARSSLDGGSSEPWLDEFAIQRR